MGLTGCIIFHDRLTDIHLRFQLCCIDQYPNEETFSCTNWFCFNLTCFASVLTWAFIKKAKIVKKIRP